MVRSWMGSRARIARAAWEERGARARAFVEHHADALFATSAIAFAVGTWWRTRNLPYHWDGAGFVTPVSRDLLATHFTPFLAEHSDYAHSPVFSALLAGCWSLFGESRLVSHALILPFLVAAMMGTYFVGVRVHGRLLGAAAAFLFATAPIVQEELGQVYIDLPTGALVTCAIAAWMADRVLAATILLCVAVAIKTPAISVAAALCLSAILRSDHRRDWRRYAVLVAPLGVLGLWLTYHRAVTGWLFIRPGIEDSTVKSVADVTHNASVIGDMLFLPQGRPVVLAAGLVALLFLIVRRPGALLLPRVAPLVLGVAAGYAFFVVSGLCALRYGLFFFPALLVAALYPVRVALRRDSLFAAAALALTGLFVADWHPRRPKTDAYQFRPDEDLGYLDMIQIGALAARFVRDRYPTAQVFGSFPEAYQLAEPYQGYVESPARFADCEAYPRTPRDSAPRLVYIHAYARGQRWCHKLVEVEGGRAIRRFESRDKWLEIWLLPDDAP